MNTVQNLERDLFRRLLAERGREGIWTGELSASALATATAVSALSLVGRERFGDRIGPGVNWLALHQNSDGGWGDTVRSPSNISATLLACAAFQLSGCSGSHAACLRQADTYVLRAGGYPALRARYGNDRTFAVPILTTCALAGRADWTEVEPLPFELACLPHRCFQWLRMPVVSYALPALIAIGQVRFARRPPLHPLVRLLRRLALGRTRQLLASIQPASGGFLEAVPLTSFVTLSLAGMGLGGHPVAARGVEFLCRSARSDGSWPIECNLSIWLTTLSIQALTSGGEPLDEGMTGPLRAWLLQQQSRVVHSYTRSPAGGWGWTHLPGSVPDADDTAGALLALWNLGGGSESRAAADAGLRWLLALQNRDGGWPTFCRGWGSLPFDRSSPDLTAHALRALNAWAGDLPTLSGRIDLARRRGLVYLERTQGRGTAAVETAGASGDLPGFWTPLWFGNPIAPGEENRTYGTARVLLAYVELGLERSRPASRAFEWLLRSQNGDGGWGGGPDTPSTVEETGLALEALAASTGPSAAHQAALAHGFDWLSRSVGCGGLDQPSPIGFYFAKLWYFERLYPLIFSAGAAGRAVRTLGAAGREPGTARHTCFSAPSPATRTE
ncbi:MAG: squalene--hopene cyclase [Planctomycetes bacterium]|nr:squalene--hopene cyclase [Planctomycetota bacterium]